MSQREGAITLTLLIEAGNAVTTSPARILAIGRSETVLSELVTILRERGYVAGATNEFDRTLDLFDTGGLDLVIFGGMVPPDTNEPFGRRLRPETRPPSSSRLRIHPRTVADPLANARTTAQPD